MTVGGTLWFADLTVPDMYFGLPIMCTIVTLAMVEFGVGSMGADISPEKAQQTKTIKYLMRGSAFLFLPAGIYVASGTCCLWVANSMFAVFQGLLLRNDSFRRLVGMETMDVSGRVSTVVRCSEDVAKTLEESADTQRCGRGKVGGWVALTHHPGG